MSDTRILDGRYALRDLLGQGGMGAVYRALDRHTSLTVAVKILKKDAIVKHPEQVERFRREAQILYELNHPNIVRIHDAVYDEGDYCIIMEYMPGGSLRDVLKREKRLPILYIVNTALDLVDALTRAHRLKIIHRDMKPDNVLLSAEGVPHLTDFGQARITDAVGLTRTGQIIGTLNYMSPEMLEGKSADARSDIWAFGIMLYELVSGYRPFMGENAADVINAIFKQPIPYVQRLRGDCPSQLAKLIHAMLERDLTARPASIREVGLHLEHTLNSLESPP